MENLYNAKRWYNSIFADGLAFALILTALGIGSCSYYYFGKKAEAEGEHPIIQSADLNGNGTPEKFYTLDEKVAVTEVDGEPILDFLKRTTKQ